MAEFTNDKMLPQSLEAEQAVLAAMFNDRDAILEVIPLLKDTDFYRHDHGVLFATMRKMNEQNVPVDLVTITAQLDKDGNLEKAGGITYVAHPGDIGVVLDKTGHGPGLRLRQRELARPVLQLLRKPVGGIIPV